MVGDSQMRRMDLVALRKRIQNALGPEKWHKYWSVLQRFMRFKLSKEELDNDARAVLGNDNVALHNQLIRGIFQNAIINTVHPPAVETPVAPDPFEPPARPDKKKKKKPQSAPAAGGKAGGAKREPQPRFSHDITWLHQQEMLRTQWTICDGADLYDESLELPSFTKLRHNMRKRCRDYSLDVPQESVEFVQKSVEVYLELVMKELQRAAKLRRSASHSGATPASPTSSEWPTITYEDFESAQEFAPVGLQVCTPDPMTLNHMLMPQHVACFCALQVASYVCPLRVGKQLTSVLNLERRSLLQHQHW